MEEVRHIAKALELLVLLQCELRALGGITATCRDAAFEEVDVHTALGGCPLCPRQEL